MLEWLVLADDRTGALEVAGEMAAWLGAVTVTVASTPSDAAVAVVDLGTRHLDPSSDADLAAVAGVWRTAGGVCFAGTAGSIAAAVAAVVGEPAEGAAVALGGEVLVVCGSLHPVARAQVDALGAGDGGVEGVTV